MSTLLATGVAATGAGLCTGAAHALDYVDARECFPTPAAVMTAHPDAAHVSWAKGTTPRCFFADRFRSGGTPPQPAVQQPAAAAQPQPQQYQVLGIPLGIPAPPLQPAAEPAQQQQQAVQEPVVQRPLRRRAVRPALRQPAVAVAPAQPTPRATPAAAPAPAPVPRTVAAPADEAPAPQAAIAVPPLPRVTTVTPQAAHSTVVRDVPDDSAADFESRFSASGYHR